MDGVWLEGTAHMCAAYQIKNETSKLEEFINVIRKAQTSASNNNGKGIVAACHDGVTTGFDWVYYNRLHIGATSWYILVEQRYNPLIIKPTPTPVTWEFPHGLIQDSSAVFARHYDGTTVSLADILSEDMPPELNVVWYYDEGAMVWKWFKLGWPESTLETLEYCRIYNIIVADGCTWTIPQTAPPPEPTPTPEECTLSFPHGLMQDPLAVFKRHYYCPTNLDLSTASPPTQLIVVWLYDEVEMEWLFWTGWPESTLDTLEYCHIYDIVVTDACTWEIPQP